MVFLMTHDCTIGVPSALAKQFVGMLVHSSSVDSVRLCDITARDTTHLPSHDWRDLCPVGEISERGI